MLTLSVLKDMGKVEKLFRDSGLTQNENSLCLLATDGKTDFGYSLFDLTKEKMTVRYIEPVTDLSLADGILRSTLHIAAERFVMEVFYADTVDESFFEKLGFIKDKEKKTLNIDKLFMGCQSCGEGD